MPWPELFAISYLTTCAEEGWLSEGASLPPGPEQRFLAQHPYGVSFCRPVWLNLEEQANPIQSPIPKSEHDAPKTWRQGTEGRGCYEYMGKETGWLGTQAKQEGNHEYRRARRGTGRSTQQTDPHMSTFVVRDFGVTFLKVHQRLNRGICTSIKKTLFSLWSLDVLCSVENTLMGFVFKGLISH